MSFETLLMFQLILDSLSKMIKVYNQQLNGNNRKFGFKMKQFSQQQCELYLSYSK